ncbi:MAG: hypothetical protein ACTSR8_01190 [Promethearchaeota archaeon]
MMKNLFGNFTFEEVRELSNSLQIGLLEKEEEISENPYSIMNPGYILYILGKIFKDINKFKASIAYFQKSYDICINNQEYSDAGEFLILKLKSERFIPNSKILKTYKDALKIFKSLSSLNNSDPYYFHSVLDIEEFAENYVGKKFEIKKKENIYRQLAAKYASEARLRELDELRSIKITKLFESINFLYKIKETLTKKDKIKRKLLINNIIYEIDTQKKFLKNNRIEMTFYNRVVSTLNLDYLLARIHIFLNKEKESKLFFFKALRSLEKLFKNPDLADLILENKRILYSCNAHEDLYKIQNIKITNDRLFVELLYSLELINLLEVKYQILIEIKKIGIDQREILVKEQEINNELSEGHEKVINYIQKELDLNSSKINEKLKNKYIAFCIFHVYQIYKLQKKKLAFLKKFKDSF